MAMGIQNVSSSIFVERNLSIQARAHQKSIEKLSSGYRINIGLDAPADLLISESLRSQKSGLEQAIRNTSESINVLGIAEGALNELNAILQRIKSLAVHAANSGITQTNQIGADQSEIDSALLTMGRVSATTRFGSEFLLNGSNSILFERTTKDTRAIVDTSNSSVYQVLKRSGLNQVVQYSGMQSTDDAARLERQARKAFAEAGATAGSRAETNTQNELVADQRFSISGSMGSREFVFRAGSSLAQIAQSIQTASNATGVKAGLVVADNGLTLRTNNAALATATSGSGATGVPEAADVLDAGQTLIFGNDSDGAGPRGGLSGVTWLNDPQLGRATDAHGRIFTRFTDNGDGTATVQLYKAAANAEDDTYAAEDLVAEGTYTLATDNTVNFSDMNGSGVNGSLGIRTVGAMPTDAVLALHTTDTVNGADRAARLDLTGDNGAWGLDIQATATMLGEAGNDISFVMNAPQVPNTSLSASLMGNADEGYRIEVTLATDAQGNITSTDAQVATAITNVAGGGGGSPLLVTVGGTVGGVVEPRAEHFLSGGANQNNGMHTEGALESADTIALSGAELGVNTDADGKLYFEVTAGAGTGDPTSILVYKSLERDAGSLVAQWSGPASGGVQGSFFLDEENDSGLRIAIHESDLTATGALRTGNSSLTLRTGLRIASTTYGDTGFVRVEAQEGKLWDMWQPEHTMASHRGYVNLTAGENTVTMESRGQGAMVEVNGRMIFADGLTADVASPEMYARISFLAGDVAASTVAQTGYQTFASTAAAGQFGQATNMAVNAGTNLRDDISGFHGGMRMQLSADNSSNGRTVYGIPSMLLNDLGQVTFENAWFKGEVRDLTLTLSDIQSGGAASLFSDPLRTMAVVDQAVADVSALRARLGATQRDMLGTNVSHLQVKLENIIKTESGIRDTDMAMEMVEYTRGQMMVQVSTSMLAQANAEREPILPLLQN